jgi:hypothetical protein
VADLNTITARQLKSTFGTKRLIHQLWLLGSQQHPQSRVLLTSFLTWGTENSLAETDLDSTGCDKGL